MSSNLTPGKVSPASSEARSPTNVSFLVDLADIQSMKQNLQELLTSFRTGKLKAFGNTSAIEQMENIRQMQVKRFLNLVIALPFSVLSRGSDAKRQRNIHTGLEIFECQHSA